MRLGTFCRPPAAPAGRVAEGRRSRSAGSRGRNGRGRMLFRDRTQF